MKIWIAIGATLCIGLAGVGWWWFRTPPENPKVAELKQMQANMHEQFTKSIAEGKAPGLSDGKKMMEMFATMRQKFAALPEGERKSILEQMNRQMTINGLAGAQEQAKEFCALSPAERAAEADKIIDQQETRRKMFSLFSFAAPGASSGGAASPAKAADKTAGSASSLPAAGDSPPGNSAPAKGPPGPPGGPANMKEAMQKQMAKMQGKEFTLLVLDHTTPETRAQMGEYIREVQQRRQSRGLPPASPFELFGPRWPARAAK